MFQYRKFDNQWMIAGNDDLAPGAKVTVTTKAGKEKVETVKALAATTADGRKVYTFEQKAKAVVEAPKAAVPGPDYAPLLEAVKKIVDGAAGKELAANFPHSFAALMDGINKAGG
jgi:predicted ATP-grasp superfamily ATP-dependent carboligase